MLKRLTALLLVIVMLSASLSSCSLLKLVAKFEDTVIEDTLISEIIDSLSTETPPPEKVTLANTSNTLYTIIISNDLEEDTQMLIMDKITQLRIDYGIKLVSRIESPRDKIEDTANEILVGLTARKESHELYDNLANGEYIIDYNHLTHRVCVLGSTSELTYTGFEYLINNFINTASNEIVIPGNLYYSERLDLPIESVSLYGVNIRDYTIVVPSLNPSEADLYAYYTALNITDYFESKLGVELKIVDDNKSEYEYEILIGDTNRAESSTSKELDEGEYILCMKDKKLVLQGYGVYVAAGMGDIVKKYLSNKNKNVNIDALSTSETVKTYTAPSKAKNAILMIGDGMGFNHINAVLNTRLDSFAAQSFVCGTSVTRSISVIEGESKYTDSAAGGTALSTGFKTINGYVGKDENGNDLLNLRELADSKGANTAVITTDVITGATPSAFLTHNISRENTEELQASIDALIASYGIEYCEGSVDNALTEHTRNALQTIAYSEDSFFMMIEEGYIDKNSHSNKMNDMLDKMVRFNDAIIYAATFTLVNADTVLIVTADHETGGLVENADEDSGYEYTTGNHTNTNVPIYALGAGTSYFDGNKIENVEIAKFIAKIYTTESFGSQVSYKK